MAKTIRLQVALARLGFASRRKAAEIIRAGKVKVNGRLIHLPGFRVTIGLDAITVDNKARTVEKKVYLILNKPRNVVTTVKDANAQRTVIDLIAPKDTRIFPVGRLDKDTTGLLLLTNDGELAYHLTHPKFEIKKVYRVHARGALTDEERQKLETGISLEGKKTYPCRIAQLSATNESSVLEVILTEGRKRQIKKMFAAVGHPALSIERIAFGPLKLKNLKQGKWRALTNQELQTVKKAAGILPEEQPKS
ncbi:MAG: pseudouridine synthase [Candidatus Omnitrophota bacterium]